MERFIRRQFELFLYKLDAVRIPVPLVTVLHIFRKTVRFAKKVFGQNINFYKFY